MIYTDLTLDYVSILTIIDGINHRRAFVNSDTDRAQLADYCPPDMCAEILAVWGDTPTVIEDITPESTDSIRARKKADVNAACKVAIYSGVEIDGKHYALTEEDQINLSTALKAIEGGAEYFLYHADGDLCEPFPAQLILVIMDAAVRHKIYHTTYCNHLNAWIRRAEGAELADIYYGAELPPDLADHMAQILGGGDG